MNIISAWGLNLRPIGAVPEAARRAVRRKAGYERELLPVAAGGYVFCVLNSVQKNKKNMGKNIERDLFLLTLTAFSVRFFLHFNIT